VVFCNPIYKKFVLKNVKFYHITQFGKFSKLFPSRKVLIVRTEQLRFSWVMDQRGTLDLIHILYQV